jgi:hypothetical protein
MADAFDFTTSEILDWELEKIHNALLRKEVGITEHAALAAQDDQLQLMELLEALLVGTPVSKDLPGNTLKRTAGINFEHQVRDQRWIRVKVAWVKGYAVITAHVI